MTKDSQPQGCGLHVWKRADVACGMNSRAAAAAPPPRLQNTGREPPGPHRSSAWGPAPSPATLPGDPGARVGKGMGEAHGTREGAGDPSLMAVV